MGGNIFIDERKTLKMSAVREVLSFDTDYISVMSDIGKVEIEGDGMRILQMSSESGELFITGRIDGVFYSKTPAKKMLFGKK